MRKLIVLVILIWSSQVSAQAKYLPEWSDPDVQKCANELAEYLAKDADFTVEDLLFDRPSPIIMDVQTKNMLIRERYKAYSDDIINLLGPIILRRTSSQFQNLRSGYSFNLIESMFHIGDICTWGTYLGKSWQDIVK
jgi:hypothetical protein